MMLDLNAGHGLVSRLHHEKSVIYTFVFCFPLQREDRGREEGGREKGGIGGGREKGGIGGGREKGGIEGGREKGGIGGGREKRGRRKEVTLFLGLSQLTS